MRSVNPLVLKSVGLIAGNLVILSLLFSVHKVSPVLVLAGFLICGVATGRLVVYMGLAGKSLESLIWILSLGTSFVALLNSGFPMSEPVLIVAAVYGLPLMFSAQLERFGNHSTVAG